MGEKIVKKLEEDQFKLFVFDKQASNSKRVASSNVTVMVSDKVKFIYLKIN